MRATFTQFRPAQPGRSIKGTFYPDAAPNAGSVLPRLVAVLAAMVFVRMIATGARRHRPGGSRWEGRMQKLADLHRELHRREGTARAGEEVTA